MGQNGMVVGKVTLDALGVDLDFFVCRHCLNAMLSAMTDLWRQAIATHNASVDALKATLGIDQEDRPDVH